MSSQKEKSDCLFCKIIRKEISSYIVYEDKEVMAFLDIKQVNRGHTLVLPKQHIKSFSEMDKEAITTVFIAAREIAKGIEKALDAQGFNIVINNKKGAGQLIDHVHIHIIPRFKNDGLSLSPWPGRDIPNEEAKLIADKIRDVLK